MYDTKQAQDKAIETMTSWAEANQRVLRELAEISAATAKESVQLYAELQQSGIEAVRSLMAESVSGAEKWFRIFEGNAQAFTRTAERLSAAARAAA